jgi:cleavage stimulation factor subunit 3
VSFPQHSPIAQATPIYEQLLSLYPTSARFWKQYVEAQMAVNNDDATKQIFSRCLLTCLQVPLWQCYIRFIRKVYDKKGAEGQEETTKAFEFMLNYIGIASLPQFWLYFVCFSFQSCLIHRGNFFRFVSNEYSYV